VIVPKRKMYSRIGYARTGPAELLHRHMAATMLGRALLPGEVVHHLDGNARNNMPENRVVLSSQRCHAHAEYALRGERLGQLHLFPEMLQSLTVRRRGSLFEHIVVIW
jgi:hypothetical protein